MLRLAARRLPSLRGAEAGISSLEVLGVMLVVGSVVGAVAATLNGERTAEQMSRAFCEITGGGGCGSGFGGPGEVGGSGARTAASGGQCVGAPAGAAGPVRGLVPVGGSSGTDDRRAGADAGSGSPQSAGLTVAVMGDGTYQVTGTSTPRGAGPSRDARTPRDAASPPTWVEDTFGPASGGAEPFLRGGSGEVYTAGSTAALAEVLAGDRERTWSGSLVGDDGPLARVAGAASGITSGREEPQPDAVFTDRSVRAGLSLNAYEQTRALDAGGEALGVLTRDDGSSTEYVGVRERTDGVDRAEDVVPLLLQLDRDPRGTLLAVRTVTDREVTPEGAAAPSGELFITHLDTGSGDGGAVVGDLAAAVGSSAIPGSSPSEPASAAPSFVAASAAFRDAAVARGYVTRQRPAGVVTTADPNADPVEAGLAQVMRAPAPEAWNGTGWTARRTSCSS